jgi:hypothetical protein
MQTIAELLNKLFDLFKYIVRTYQIKERKEREDEVNRDPLTVWQREFGVPIHASDNDDKAKPAEATESDKEPTSRE